MLVYTKDVKRMYKVQMKKFDERIDVVSRDGKIILSLAVYDDGDYSIIKKTGNDITLKFFLSLSDYRKGNGERMWKECAKSKWKSLMKE